MGASVRLSGAEDTPGSCGDCQQQGESKRCPKAGKGKPAACRDWCRGKGASRTASGSTGKQARASSRPQRARAAGLRLLSKGEVGKEHQGGREFRPEKEGEEEERQLTGPSLMKVTE